MYATHELQQVPLSPYQPVPRRVERATAPSGTELRSNGFRASLVDLSPHGAQIVSRSMLRPDQQVRLILRDGTGPVRLAGLVVWSKCELVAGNVQYRVGIEFDQPSAIRLRHVFESLVHSSCRVTPHAR